MFFLFFLYPPNEQTNHTSVNNKDYSVYGTLFKECTADVGGAIFFQSKSHTLELNNSYFMRCVATSSITWNTRTVSGGGVIAYCKLMKMEMVCFYQCRAPTRSGGSVIYFYTSEIADYKESYVTMVSEQYNGDFYADICNHEMKNVNSTKSLISLSWGTHKTVISYCQVNDVIGDSALYVSNAKTNTNIIKNTNFVSINPDEGVICSWWYSLSCIDCVFNRCTGKLWTGSHNGTVVLSNPTVDGQLHTFGTVFYHCVNPSDRFTSQESTVSVNLTLLMLLLLIAV